MNFTGMRVEKTMSVQEYLEKGYLIPASMK